jgi:PEP-CTERM motif
MLKKLSIIAVSSIIAASAATADINVNWKSADGFLRIDDATGILEPVNTGVTALAQLIYAPANAYSAATAAVGGAVEAGYQILDTYVITDALGTDAYGIFSESYSGTFQAGFIYVRVFDGGTGNPANIVGGTWFYDSPIVATINNLTPDSPDTINANGANTSPSFGFGDVLYKQVPEPTTLAFLGIGGVVLALRRRKA